MMRKVYLSLLFIAISIKYQPAFGQIVTGDKISVKFLPQIASARGKFIYNYAVINKQEAKQEVYRFWLLPPKGISIDSLLAPSFWSANLSETGELLIINCITRKANIKPGSTLYGLMFHSESLPGIIQFYAEGEHPLPKFSEGMAPDSIPGYDDLTPYGPGIVGKTVGPVLPPTPFVALAFLDTLISYKHQAFALGWIKNQGIVQSLDAKLDNAKRQLQRNNTTAARNTLQAFLNEVEALWKDEEHPYGGKQITSEAYALLKFNAEYLVSKL
jgi:hypothetical protein